MSPSPHDAGHLFFVFFERPEKMAWAINLRGCQYYILLYKANYLNNMTIWDQKCWIIGLNLTALGGGDGVLICKVIMTHYVSDSSAYSGLTTVFQKYCAEILSKQNIYRHGLLWNEALYFAHHAITNNILYIKTNFSSNFKTFLWEMCTFSVFSKNLYLETTEENKHILLQNDSNVRTGASTIVIFCGCCFLFYFFPSGTNDPH